MAAGLQREILALKESWISYPLRPLFNPEILGLWSINSLHVLPQKEQVLFTTSWTRVSCWNVKEWLTLGHVLALHNKPRPALCRCHLAVLELGLVTGCHLAQRHNEPRLENNGLSTMQLPANWQQRLSRDCEVRRLSLQQVQNRMQASFRTQV